MHAKVSIFDLTEIKNMNLFRSHRYLIFVIYARWEFKTFDHDIRFGIKRVNDKTGEENIEIELRRVASHQLDEEGYIACQQDWTCTNYFI